MNRILLPEEQELARLEAEQADLEEQVASAELALETIRNETAVFQRHYYRTVGHLYAKLDDINAKIARMRAAQASEDSVLRAHAYSAQEQAKRSSEEAGLIEKQFEPPPVTTPGLKQAYRRAVKLMHPDLAISEPERQRRTKLMASLNLAYERGDLNTIEQMVSEFGQDPEAIVGEDIGSRIVKTIRRIAQLRRRLGELKLELEAHENSEAYELRKTIEAAHANGGDPLGDLARQLTKEISEREAELKAIMRLAGVDSI
jgi:hypothetical protein